MLKPSFFLKPTLHVAKSLLGCQLITEVDGARTSGMIVEVEAYCGKDDPAAHSFGGMTSRTEAMFRAGGICYVYFIYGMHYCVNVVTEAEGIGAAVLIRAVEPIEGIEIMKVRRKVKDLKNLTNGPGKVCQAFGIDKKMYGENLLTSRLIRIKECKNFKSHEMVTSPRIGISKALEFDWRFYVKNSSCVSRFVK